MMVIPKKMKCIQVTQPGGPNELKVGEVAVPEPKEAEVLIEVRAAGVNRPDILQRKGLYPPPEGASPLLGLEVAGVIVQCGPKSEPWKIGDAVCALVSGGGYAQYCVAPAGQCLPIPRGWSFEEAAGIPETFFTVWFNLFQRGGLKAGETLLVHGGSSGIGTTAIQLAKAFGARVFVTAGSPEKCQACLKLGADDAVNYRTQDFVQELRARHRSVDLILDMVGGEYFAQNLELLAPEGRLIQIASQKGEQVPLSIRTLMKKGLTVMGSTLRPRSVAQKTQIASELREKVWPLLEASKIRVLIDQALPLDQCAALHQRMEKSEHIGKLILTF
ncbi:MAG: NAD(P)H-quinone oxidoreductase [Bdellovibrionia bacterium]